MLCENHVRIIFVTYMKLNSIIPLVILIWLHQSCNNHSKNEISSELKGIQSLDSASLILNKNPKKSNFFEFARLVKIECQKNYDTLYTNKYINLLFHYGKIKKSPYCDNLAEQCKVIQQFIVGNTPQARYWSKQALKSTSKSEEIDKLDVYHIVGLSYYMPPMVSDSVIKYWELGFEHANAVNDGYRIYFYSNNLGSLFHEMNMESISRRFFLNALEQAKINKNVSPILVNNIINTFFQKNKYQEALEYYEEYETLLNVDPSNFENQAIYLNKIHINQALNKPTASDSLLKQISIDQIHKSHRAHFLSLCIQQYLMTKDPYYLSPEIKQEAPEWGIDLITNLNKDVAQLKIPELAFVWEIIEKDVNQKLKSQNNARIPKLKLLSALKLLIKKYEYASPIKRDTYLKHFALITLEGESEKEEINNHINKIKKADDLFDLIVKREAEIKNQNAEIQKLFWGFGSLIILMIGSILFYQMRLKLRKKQEEILLREKDILIRENKMNKRLVEFSKELIQFNKKIKSELDKLNFTGDNATFLTKFRSDLLGFITMNLEHNPTAFDHPFDTGVKDIRKNNKIWEQLNKTEKRVYSLVEEGFKANEIARMLGVTTQYVYNVKTKLKNKGIDWR